MVCTNREGGSSNDVGVISLGRSTHRNALPRTDRPPVIGTFAIHKATRRTSDTYTAFSDSAHEVLVQHRTCSGQISLHG